MKVTGKSYTGVSEMLSDTAGTEFAEDFERFKAARQLARSLQMMRIALGMSEAELATKIGCRVATVRRIEAIRDMDLRIGDILRYAKGVDAKLTVELRGGDESGELNVRLIV